MTRASGRGTQRRARPGVARILTMVGKPAGGLASDIKFYSEALFEAGFSRSSTADAAGR